MTYIQYIPKSGRKARQTTYINHRVIITINYTTVMGDRGSTVVKVLCYKSVGRWFDPSWCQWIFH